MKLADSHCHLNMVDLAPYGGDLQQLLSFADSQGVAYFLSVAVTLEEHPILAKLADQFPNVYISVGMHPNENPQQSIVIENILQAAQHPKVVAIGETGLDYYRSEGDLHWQRERFAQHIACARSCKKPLIIHSRAAKEDTINMLHAHNAIETGGVMHCFTEDWETAKKALDLGFFISFSGIVTFKNATELQDVARQVPVDRLLIETDSPYLAPIPHRGKPNVPAYVRHVAEFLAQLRNEPLEQLAFHTTQNFFKLFNISIS